MILHDYLPSGNGYKIRLLLSLLGQSFQLKEYDIVKGESRTPEFLALNPNGKIPVLQLDDGRCLSESNATLYYLAQGTDYWPKDSWQQAKVLQWMNFEQYSHEPNIATVRFWLTHSGMNAEREAQLAAKREAGYAALQVMEQQLSSSDWLVGEFSIADIALYAYTHVAEEGGFSLSDFPAIRAWCQRITQLSAYIGIDYRPEKY